KGENTLTIAIKSGHSDILQDIFFHNESLNQQDTFGNTALHYAIELKDKYAIIILAYYGADTNIKNNEGKTAMDLAHEWNDETIFELL
ncbi:ankyrin, partial [Anaeromyces robustus]